MSDNNKYIPQILIVFLVGLPLLFSSITSGETPDIVAFYELKSGTGYYFPYLKTKDTIHLLGNEYIEIRLKEQKAHLFRRGDSTIIYKISTGNASLEKGLTTPVGFFTVQSKSPMAISKQFENAELYNWVGFNGNIGFHGLKKTGYYAALGIRPSSHGCVRIGNESGQDMYKRVRRGTPVIVYYDKPAIEMVFSEINEFNPSRDYLLVNNPVQNTKQFSRRIKNLEQGLALRKNSGRVFLDGVTMLKPGGYVIGSENELPASQLRPYVTSEYGIMQKDNLVSSSFKPIVNDSLVKIKIKDQTAKASK